MAILMRAAAPEQVEAALRAIGTWAPDLDPDDRYVDLGSLVADGLASRIAGRLGGAPARVGHSALLMGVTSRLWVLTVVPYVTHGVVVDPSTFVARDDDGALVLGVTAFRGFTDVTPADLADLVLGVLRPVVDAVPLAPRLLWGNAAASLHALPRVERLPAAAAIVADLLDRPPFAGELDLTSTPPGRRLTCCLFYLVEGAGLCGDCVLTELPARSG